MGDTFDDGGSRQVEKSLAFSSQLVVLLECDRAWSGGARYSLADVDVVAIGRAEERGVVRRSRSSTRILEVALPGRSLSGQHARLVRVGASWALEDLGSRNGTSVNGQRISRAVLESGQVFDVGHTLLCVNATVATPPDAEQDVDAGSATDALTTLDPVLAETFAALLAIAPSSVPVLVLGETGTGKEILARHVHGATGRRGDLFAVNCGAIPSTLVESTLFGHTKGAFSGAVRDEPGVFRAAHGGTLFLDEIGDLPKVAQAVLLRALQEHEVTPVGASRPVPVDVRLIAATNAGLDELVERGDFRKDLFARIAGFVVRLPALRHRRHDFGVFVAALLAKIAGARARSVSVAPEVGRALLAYDWPLNIRELEQCLAVCLTLARGERIERWHLPGHIVQALDSPPAAALRSAGGLSVRDEQVRSELLAMLARHEGNVADVARAMGKARMQIHRWCKRFGVNPNAYRK